MPIEDVLLKDERILASAKQSSEATLYATDKRVIRYEKGFFKEKVDSLYYPHIVGASYQHESYNWCIPIGILLIILIPIIRLVAPRFVAWFGQVWILFDLGLILIGVSFVLMGFYSPAWYQLKAVGLTEMELELWRTAGVSEEAKTFARFIQDQISTREIPLPPQPPITREVITREIVMVKCDYCGGLIPQTAVFCPNCGAKRKA